MKSTTRRQFLQAIAGSVAGGAWLVSESCAGPVMITGSIDAGIISVPKKEFTEKSFVIVRASTLAYPIYVRETAVGRFTALYLRCTHRGCEVQPGNVVLTCPCHGSEYDVAGGVQHGPAELPLHSYEVTIDDAKIYIHLPA